MDILCARFVPAPSKADLMNAWTRAIEAHDKARFADWHPDKGAEVEAARRACMAARRAYYDAT